MWGSIGGYTWGSMSGFDVSVLFGVLCGALFGVWGSAWCRFGVDVFWCRFGVVVGLYLLCGVIIGV